MVIGTPFFMSPEQCEGKPVDARSDIYSLGASYYSLLTGRNPFHESDSVPRVMYNHCHGPIPNPCDVVSSVPPACARIVGRAMAKSPADRYQSAAEMLPDLEMIAATLSGQSLAVLPSESRLTRAATMPSAAFRGQPARSRRAPLFATALAGIAVAALALFLWKPWHKPAGAPVALAPVGEPIKVGVLHSLSGTMAVSATVVVDATLFAIDEINQSGGVLGRQVKAVVADGRSDWPTFAREARRLIEQEKVVTVFGCWTSSSRKTVKPIFEEHDHLLLYPVQYEGVENSPCIVYLGAAPNQQIIPAVEWAIQSLHKKRFFLVGSDYVFPRTANEVIKDQIKKLGGEIVGERYLPFGNTEVDRTVAAIAQARPDMILNTINGDTNIAFFRELRGVGVKPADVPTMSFSIGEQELRNFSAADIVGDYAAWTYFQSVSTPENAEFVSRFQEKFPQRSVTDPMEAAYVGVKLWARAVAEAQSLKPKLIRRALLNQRLKAPEGEVRIDPDTQHLYKTPRIGRIRGDGQFDIVWTAPEPVRPDPYPPTRTAAEWRAFLHDLYTGWGNQWVAPQTGPTNK
jgi:urea transport system substrate-binding protein